MISYNMISWKYLTVILAFVFIDVWEETRIEKWWLFHNNASDQNVLASSSFWPKRTLPYSYNLYIYLIFLSVIYIIFPKLTWLIKGTRFEGSEKPNKAVITVTTSSSELKRCREELKRSLDTRGIVLKGKQYSS